MIDKLAPTNPTLLFARSSFVFSGALIRKGWRHETRLARII